LKLIAAYTSYDEDVTPPLLVEASLNKITPESSNFFLAPSEQNKFAPSTIYLNLGVPSFLNILLTFYRFTDSGLPPQGTKKSAATSGCKWKLFLKCKPDSTISPLGSFLFSSVTSTK